MAKLLTIPKRNSTRSANKGEAKYKTQIIEFRKPTQSRTALPLKANGSVVCKLNGTSDIPKK